MNDRPRMKSCAAITTSICSIAGRRRYKRSGFVPAPTDPYHLFVLLKDVRTILKQR